MRIAVFDTETTGLPKHPKSPLAKQPKIIEFAARIVDDGEPTDEEISFLANPGEPLEEVITKITGLTDADLKDEPPFRENIDRVHDFFASCDGVAAHNLPFDSQMVWFEVLRAGLDTSWRWPHLMLCTVQFFTPKYGFKPKLVRLYKDLTGEPYPQTHRALDDVNALVEIVCHGEIFEALSAFENKVGLYLSEDICPDRGPSGRYR